MSVEVIDTKDSKYIQLINFDVNYENYGVELENVEEVIRLPKIINIPNSKDFIKGMINLRGKVIPVVDLRKKFGLESNNYSDFTRAIIIRLFDKSVGIIVDNVNSVIKINKDDIEESPSLSNEDISDYIKGVGKYRTNLITIFDFGKLFSSEEKEHLDQIIETN